MSAEQSRDLTEVLHAVGRGEEQAEKLLFERVYEELRGIAHGRLRGEAHKPTLIETTDLVNEAYLRLVRTDPSSWENRRHFFGAAVEAMRRILIEYARRRKAVRRGQGVSRITLTDAMVADTPSYEILSLTEALDRLVAIRARAAKVVEYRFFLGLSVHETARALSISERTVNLDWRFANAWLRREISAVDQPPD